MTSISYEAFLDDAFSPEEWVQAHTPFLQPIFSNLNYLFQTVLDHAANSGTPDTFIQTVLTKLSLLSNDANSSLDVAAHALQVPQPAAQSVKRRVADTLLQEALGRCAASIESSAQDVLMLRDDITAAAAAAAVDGGATSDLQELKLLSSAQARLSNIVQASATTSVIIV